MQISPQNDRKSGQPAMKTPPIVSPQEWEAAREQLLVKEKALTRARDALAADRRRMPWLAVRRSMGSRGPGQGEPARPVRWPPPADRLPRLLRTRGARLAEHACIGCSLGPTRSPTSPT